MSYTPTSKPRAIGMFSIVATLILIIACGTTAPDAPEPTTASVAEPTQAPVAGETPMPTATASPLQEVSPTPAAQSATSPTGTLNIGLPELGPFGAHPSFSRSPAHQVLHTAPLGEALMTFDADSKIVPLLAREWSISEDFTTWTFKLEQGVQFSKGYGEMTAEDVAWSYDQWAQNDLHARVTNLRDFWKSPEGSVTTPDPHTVVVDTGTPIVDTLVFEFSTIASHGSATSVASKKQTEEIGAEDADKDISTTAPWEIVEHRTGEFWRMAAVEDHWRQTPHFAEMVFWEIPEESSRLAGFQTGNLDTFIMAFDSIPLVESVPGAKLMRVPNAGPMMIRIYGQYYLDLGTENQREAYNPDLPWVSSNPEVGSAEWEQARKVRLAMMTAIDTQSIIDTLLQGFGRPAVLHGFVGHEHLLDPDMKWEYNPERAQELLAEAGYPGGGFSITLIPAIRQAPSEVDVCEAVGEMWRTIGIDVQLQRIPYNTLRPQLQARTFNGALCFGGRTRQAPVEDIALMRADGTTAGSEHPWVEDITDRMRRTIDPAERAQLEKEWGRFLFDNVMGPLAIYSWDTVWPVGPRIEEWSDHVKNFDVRGINGYEYIQHREP